MYPSWRARRLSESTTFPDAGGLKLCELSLLHPSNCSARKLDPETSWKCIYVQSHVEWRHLTHWLNTHSVYFLLYFWIVYVLHVLCIKIHKIKFAKKTHEKQHYCISKNSYLCSNIFRVESKYQIQDLGYLWGARKKEKGFTGIYFIF